MTTDLHDRADQSEIERRLRDAYATMVPLLASESTSTTDAAPTTGPNHIWEPPTDIVAPRGGPGVRLLAAAAAVMLVVGGLVALRQTRAETNPAANAPPPSIDRTDPLPDWYTDLQGLLPDGFDRVAVRHASDSNVEFVAFRSGSPQVLDIQVSLDALYGAGVKPEISPDARTDDVGVYLESPGEVRLVTTDGRFVVVRCGVGPVGNAEQPLGPASASAQPCAAAGSAAPIDQIGLRQIARDLATGYPTERRDTSIRVRELSDQVRNASASQAVNGLLDGAAISDDALSTIRQLDLSSDLSFANGQSGTTVMIFASLTEPFAPSDAPVSTEAVDPPRIRFTEIDGLRTALVTAHGYAFHIVTSVTDEDRLDELSQLLDRLVAAAAIPDSSSALPSASTVPAPSTEIAIEVDVPITSSVDTCDDAGRCQPLRDLPVVDGASDFYVGPDSLGTPTVQLDWFDTLVRCTSLDLDMSACAELEGIAGVGLVGYGPGDPAIIDGPEIEIGTTFTRLTPSEYADAWSIPPEFANPDRSTEEVRGQPAEFFWNFNDNFAVWNERPGVLVWVKVPAARSDDLRSIAEGVRRVPGPVTIPWKEVIADDVTGWQFDATSNDGRNLLLGRRTDGSVCTGFGHLDTACSPAIADRTFTTTDGDRVLVTGTAPIQVTDVRVRLADGSTVDIVTRQLDNHEGRFYSGFVEVEGPATVEWLSGDVIDSTTIDIDFCLTACG